MPTDSRAAWTESLSVVHRGGARALDGVDLAIERGRITALVGANGSGKSTLIGALAGTVPPTEGRAFVLDVARHERAGERELRATRARCAYASQEIALDPEAHARSLLGLFAVLHGISRESAAPRVRVLVDRLDLAALLDRPVARLSGGERRRVHVACALLHEAELVLLDEPTAGLDERSRIAMWSELRERARAGAAVLVATHELDALETVVDEIVVLDGGRILARGSPRELLERHARSFLVATSRAGAAVAERLEALAARFPGALAHRVHDRELVLEVADARASAAVLLARLGEHELDLERLELREPSLASAFRALTGRDLDDLAVSASSVEPRSARAGRGRGA